MKMLVLVTSGLRQANKTAAYFNLLIMMALWTAFAEAGSEATSVNGRQASSITASSTSTQPIEPSKQSKLIYKSVDAQGRVSFGDQPGVNAVELETLQRPTYQQNVPAEQLQTRLEQMAATTKRLQEDRKLRVSSRREEAEARKNTSSVLYPPLVVVEKRVYRPQRRHPYLYQPHYYDREMTYDANHSGSSLGLHLGGGSSKFHYGLSYGSQQRHGVGRSVQTPYHNKQGSKQAPRLLKRSHQ